MPTVKIPLGTLSNKNADAVELNENMQEIVNGFLGEVGDGPRPIKTRPGLIQALDQSGEWYGGFYWRKRNAVFWAGGGKLLEARYENGSWTSTVYSDVYTGELSGSSYPTFAIGAYLDGREILAIANGQRVVFLDESGTTSVMSDPNAPTRVTHIAFIDGYLIMNNRGEGRWYWTNLNEPTSVSALDFAAAEGQPDEVLSLYVYNREIFIFGPDTVEIWENDGESPFARVPGGMIQTGCAARYSPIVRDDGIYWLDSKRRVVVYDGKGSKPISGSYDKEFQDLSRVDDCVAHDITIGGVTFFVFTFPTSQKTLVYNLATQDWNRWGEWISQTGEFVAFRGRGYAYYPPANKHLISCGANTTKIYELSFLAGQDDDAPIRLIFITGHISHGVLRAKRSNELRVRMKRGSTTSTTEPKLMVRWRDDNKRWSNEHQIGLGLIGDSAIVGRLLRTGIYRTRQWEMSLTNVASVVIAEAEEDIEVMTK